MGFMDSYLRESNNVALGFAQGDADRANRRANELYAELVDTSNMLNYQRLCARAWEAVAESLAQQKTPVSPEDLQRLYLSKRKEIFKSGRVKGRDKMGQPRADHKIGGLNKEIIEAINQSAP